MTTTPTCVACGVKRRSVAIAPANDLYDFWSYKCPKCETVVKVVKPHEARSVQGAYGEHRVLSCTNDCWCDCFDWPRLYACVQFLIPRGQPYFYSAGRSAIARSSSGSGRCNDFASSHGALIQTSRSSSVVRITGMAFGWIGGTTAFGAVVCGNQRSSQGLCAPEPKIIRNQPRHAAAER
jgi:hypothetical protein